MSQVSESSAQAGQGDKARDTVDAYVLIGEEVVVLARPWAHGSQSGYTVEKIFAKTSGYEDLDELESLGELFPEVSSETIAEDLTNGKLIKLDTPVPVPAPSPHRTNKDVREAREREREREREQEQSST